MREPHARTSTVRASPPGAAAFIWGSVFVVFAGVVSIVAVVGGVVWWYTRPFPSSRRLPPLVIPIRPHGEFTPEPPAWMFARPNSAGPASRPTDVERAIVTGTDGPAPTETVRFRRPTDDAVQLLPGRFEVIAGEPRHKEIRLVRVPGEKTEVVLGREPGDSPQHVALQSNTVSRRHARLAYANGHWAVANLSQTNPIVVNDEPLANGDGERTLADGDRLELGEVVLRFHAR